MFDCFWAFEDRHRHDEWGITLRDGEVGCLRISVTNSRWTISVIQTEIQRFSISSYDFSDLGVWP